VIVAGYVVCAMPTAGDDRGHLFLSNLFYLSGTGVLAIVTSAAYERLRWREFTTRRDLVDAYRQRNVFLANMSHELRTPIHVMIGYADILLEGALARGGDEAQMLVEVSRRQGVVLHRLISDLLDFSKIEAGKMELNVEPLDLGVVIAQAAESFRPVAERKGLRFLTTIAELPRVRSDRHRLEQILNNLIGNAVKFTDTGEVRIAVTTAAALAPDLRADLVVLADGAGAPPALARDGVVIAVTDTGIGIRDADFAKLANDFQQLEGAARYGGTGLGLSFARKLVGLLGGVMMVRSRAGEGSTFAVFLPAEESAPQRQPAPAAA
jgi:signal transduction histidine kinase